MGFSTIYRQRVKVSGDKRAQASVECRKFREQYGHTQAFMAAMVGDGCKQTMISWVECGHKRAPGWVVQGVLDVIEARKVTEANKEII